MVLDGFEALVKNDLSMKYADPGLALAAACSVSAHKTGPSDSKVHTFLPRRLTLRKEGKNPE